MGNYNIVLSATDAGFTATLKRAEAEMLILNRNAVIMSAAFSAMRTGLIAGVASIAAMILPSVMASKSVGEFDANLRRATAIESTFEGNTEELTNTLNDLSIQYGVSANELSAGVVEFAKAGFDYSTIMNELFIPTTQLAIANMTDFETASRIATYTFSLFGPQITDTRELLEKLNVAANISLLNIEEMGSAIEYSGSSAVVAGVRYEEYLAALASLSNLAVKSQQNFGTLISRIMVSGEELNDLLGNSGIVVDGVVNLTELMKSLQDVTLTESQMTKLGEMWGIRSGRIFFSLMKSARFYDAALAEIEASNDTLTKQGNAMAQSIPAMWQRIVNALTAPIRSPVVLEKFNASLNKLLAGIESSRLPELVADIVGRSADFLAKSNLIGTLEKFMEMVDSLYPKIADMANFFMILAKAASYMPSALWLTIGAFVMLNRILPLASVYTLLAAHHLKQYTQTAVENIVMNNKYVQAVHAAAQANVELSVSTKIAESAIRLQTDITADVITMEELATRARLLSSQGNITAADSAQIRWIAEQQLLTAGKMELDLTNLLTVARKHTANALRLFTQDSIQYEDALREQVYLENLLLDLQGQRQLLGRRVGEATAVFTEQTMAQRNLASATQSVVVAQTALDASMTKLLITQKNYAIDSKEVAVAKKEVEQNTTTLAIAEENQAMATERANIANMEAANTANLAASAKKLAGSSSIMYTSAVNGEVSATWILTTAEETLINTQNTLSLSTEKAAMEGRKLGIVSQETAQKINLMMTVGMFSVLQGIMLFISSKDGLVRALGAISVAVGGVTTALLMMGWAKEAATKGMIMALAMGATAIIGVAGMWASMRAQEKKAREENKKLTQEATAPISIPDLSTLTTNEEEPAVEPPPTQFTSQVGGLVKTTGWRFIHKGEFVVPEKSVAAVKESTARESERTNILTTLSKNKDIQTIDVTKNIAESVSKLVETITSDKRFVSTDISGKIDEVSMDERILPVVPLVGEITEITNASSYELSLRGITGTSPLEEMVVTAPTDAVLSKVGSAEGGLVKSKGWRYIHEGEFIVPKETVSKVDTPDKSDARKTGIIEKITDSKFGLVKTMEKLVYPLIASGERMQSIYTERTDRVTDVSLSSDISENLYEKFSKESEREKERDIYKSLKETTPLVIYKETLREEPGMAYFSPVPSEIASERILTKSMIKIATDTDTKEITREVEKKVGSEDGGFVKKEGWRFIHSGEIIVPEKEIAIVNKTSEVNDKSVENFVSTKENAVNIYKEKNKTTLIERLIKSISSNISQTTSISDNLVREKKVSSAEGGEVIQTGWRYVEEGEWIVPPEDISKTAPLPGKPAQAHADREERIQTIVTGRLVKVIEENTEVTERNTDEVVGGLVHGDKIYTPGGGPSVPEQTVQDVKDAFSGFAKSISSMWTKYVDAQKAAEAETKRMYDLLQLPAAPTLEELPGLTPADHTGKELVTFMNYMNEINSTVASGTPYEDIDFNELTNESQAIDVNPNTVGIDVIGDFKAKDYTPGEEAVQPYTYIPSVQAEIPAPPPNTPETPGTTATTAAVNNYFYDNKTVNNYQVEKEDLERVLQTNGR